MRRIPECQSVLYPEVCAGYGALEVAQLTGDTNLQARLVQNFAFVLTPAGATHISTNSHVDFRVFGVVPLEIYLLTKDERFLALGKSLADAQWENVTADGITAEARYWIDDMFMITALQVETFRATGDAKYLDRAALTMSAYLDKLQQPNGLFYHGTNAPFLLEPRQWMGGGGHTTELLRSLPGLK